MEITFNSVTLTIILSVIGFITWLVRLEQRVNTTKEKVDKVEIKNTDSYRLLESKMNNEVSGCKNEEEKRQKKYDDDLVRVYNKIDELAGELREINSNVAKFTGYFEAMHDK